MLVLEGVSRRFGGAYALRDVSLRVGRGELVALTGPNGAGKTTLLRLVATLDAPTRGRVLVDGLDPRTDGAAARRRLAYVGQEPGLYEDMSVRENLAFYAGFFGNAGGVEDAARRCGIAHRLDRRVRGLSRGERQRAALARGLLGGEIMVLDEPTTGLDLDAAATASWVLRGLRGERTILLATHDELLASACDRVVRLEAGRVVAGKGAGA